MQHVPVFGYPTPPASPVYGTRCLYQQPMTTVPPSQARYIPMSPEARLGRFLEGKLQLTSILGTGAYGVVYAAVDVKTGLRYAVKCLSKFNPDGTPLDRRQLAFQNREIRLHYLASAHPNVVSMLKIVDEPDCIYVILEYCPEGDLFLNITERGAYVGKDALARSVFLQILDAVEHCHSLGIYHRDLKPENILVTDHGDTVKLADFGLAIAADRSEDYGCGSTFYMSPECLDHDARRPFYYCAPNDIWSLGVILVNLTCGRNPWKQASCEDSTYRAYLRSKDFLKTILPVSDDLNSILGRIFESDPAQRISIRELRARILACPYFTVPAVAPAAPVAVAAAPVAVPAALPSPPVSPQPTNPAYVPREDASILSDPQDAALSPAPSASDDSDSDCSDDDVSLVSSDSTIDDLDDDFFREQQQETARERPLFTYDPESPPYQQLQQQPQPQEIVADQYTGPVPGHFQAQVPHHHPQAVSYAPEKASYVPVFWDQMVKYVQQQQYHGQHPQAAYQGHHQGHHQPFHHQVPLFVAPQGCY